MLKRTLNGHLMFELKEADPHKKKFTGSYNGALKKWLEFTLAIHHDEHVALPNLLDMFAKRTGYNDWNDMGEEGFIAYFQGVTSKPTGN